MRKKSLPYPLINAKGQLFDYNNGIVDQEANHLKILAKGRKQRVDFDIIPLGQETDIILGMAWLRQENPIIDWRNGQVTFPSNPKSSNKTITRNNKRSQTLTNGEGIGILQQQDPRKEPEPTPSQDRLANLYSLNEGELRTQKEYINKILKKGYIRESSSSSASSMFFILKKNGKPRPVINYQPVNARTIKDRTPLPLITELKDQLQGKKIFTALDLKGAYNLIRIKEGDEWKTAFRTRFGLFKYVVMPFGLTNAPATFQRMINSVLQQYLDIFIVYYLDNILIFSNNEEEHREHVHKVLKTLQNAKLLVKPEKSHFHVTKEFRHYLMGKYLCKFDFIIIYCKGSENGKADVISRRPDYNTGTTKAKEQVLEKNKKGEYRFTQQIQTLGWIQPATTKEIPGEPEEFIQEFHEHPLAYNTAYNESTKLTPSDANFSYTPKAYYDAQETEIINPAAIIKSKDLKNIHNELRTELEFVNKRIQWYYNSKRLEGPTFKEGDMVYLSTKNITTKQPSHKLDFKYIGPYKIVRKISKNNYKLDLPTKVRLHKIFHIALLKSAANTIHVKIGNKPEEIDRPELYKAEAIKDIDKINGQTIYLIKWKNYPENENT
ncbi:hypothetical protein FANTH_9943 [Fusarium anthophilum]|uniref:Reverse transcriptase domain-containing protein n=1 Tax=Fusarium anthophilum TaxID=48485 RepID=A0A8H4Z437_9HYPO|nr:hypothetical protein FANTH_9943 [Fusarium anthophilum]